MRLKRLGCGVCLAAGASTVALVVAEVLLRLFLPQPLLHDPDAFIADPVLGARLKPGFHDRVVTTEFTSTWVINHDGYRGPLAGERGPASRRVVAVGDSFTFGYGVEEEQAWPRVLEALLNQEGAGNGRWEVVNLGVGGYGTWEEEDWLAQQWEKLRPDLVLVGFYPGNDPTDNVRGEARAASMRRPPGDSSGPVTSEPATASGPSRAEAVKRWLGSRFHVYSLVSTRFDEMLVHLRLRRLVYPFEMEVLQRDEPAQVTAGWEATRHAFERLASWAHVHAVRAVVIVIPMKHQVSPSVWRRLLRAYGGEERESRFDLQRPQSIVRDLCEHEGLEVVDLLNGLRTAGGLAIDARDLYWPRDQHFNARGHAATASLIAEWIRGANIFDGGPLRR